MKLAPWWKNAVCYQIYPRSYADFNQDGIGDIQGIIHKLDYLKWLGITVLWISPFYPSPNFDWGYDISDFTNVDPDYGTLADIDLLIEEAHKRDIRILFDIVLNHTSNQHPWFLSAVNDPDGPYRDFYVWQKGKQGELPNDWESIFGGPAWELEPNSGEYYYHCFFKEQPDLNWRNPKVKQAMFDVLRFWLDRGVDGFRLDAIGTIYEAENFPNCEVDISLEEMFLDTYRGKNDQDKSLFNSSIYNKKTRFQNNLPEVHDLIKEIRGLVDDYEDRILLGEIEDVEFYGKEANELHSMFNFPLIVRTGLDAKTIHKNLSERYKALPAWAWECNTVGNHDRARSFSFYSDGKDNQKRARMALALVAFLRGTPVFYNGEEIGMKNYQPAGITDIKDRLGIFFYDLLRKKRGLDHKSAFDFVVNEMCRDYCRTPMQWENAPNAGFSPEGVETWLPVNKDYEQGVNVSDQKEDPTSMLNYFRELIQIRQANPALMDGDIELLEDKAPVFAFTRRSEDQHLMVVFNMSGETVLWHSPDKPELIIYSSTDEKINNLNEEITLLPYQILIYEV
ncbi:MAG: glucohydrolase [Anaerolineaceae bacterium]|nr:glucohydrolase [Anaerolineaceae bacterium]